MQQTKSLSANLYNSALVSYSISAAFDIGLLEELKQKECVNLENFCAEHNLHLSSIKALVYALACFDIVNCSDQDNKNVAIGSNFSEVFPNKGFFLWIHGGYGNLLQNLSTLMKNNDLKKLSLRNGAYIAKSGKDYGLQYVDVFVDDILKKIDFRCLADLGCGSANRLIRLARQNKNFKGVGVEINLDAITFARQKIAEEKLSDQITIYQGDVTNLTPCKDFEKVEVLTSFFMGHDLWPRERCLGILNQLLEVFPNVKYFLLCDTYSCDQSPTAKLPIFTLGFELIHAFMREYVPSIAEWKSLFKDSKWNYLEQIDIKIPFSSVFLLTPKK